MKLIDIRKRGDAIAVHLKLEPGLEVRVTVRRKLEVGKRGTNVLGHDFPHVVEVRGEDGLGDPIWTPMRNPPQDMLPAALFFAACDAVGIVEEPTPIGASIAGGYPRGPYEPPRPETK